MTLQDKIIAELGVKPEISPEAEVRRSVDFLKEYLKQYPFLKSLVLGISGGQDSSLAGRLAQLAIEELRAETGDTTYQFIAVRLPYGVQQDEDDAQRALDFIKPDVSLTVNIKRAVDGKIAALTEAGLAITDFNKGDIYHHNNEKYSGLSTPGEYVAYDIYHNSETPFISEYFKSNYSDILPKNH